MTNNRFLLLIVLLGAGCTTVDFRQTERISYSVEGTGTLPIDTSNRFTVWYTLPDGSEQVEENIHRFNASIEVEVPFSGRLRVVPADSLQLRATVTRNGVVIEEETGNEPVVEFSLL